MTTPTFDINAFRIDRNARAHGVWVDFGGARFKLRSLENADFTEAFAAAAEPWTSLGRKVPVAEQERIMAETVAAHIVVDWENVFDGDAPFPFSRENALRLFTEAPPILERVIAQARTHANFRAAEDKRVEGN